MSKRVSYLTTYLVVMISLTVLRIAVNVDLFGNLGEWELDFQLDDLKKHDAMA